METVLSIAHLTTEFQTRHGTVRALSDFSCSVGKGEILGIVGESGSGKSVSMLSVMGLLAPNSRVTGGSIVFDGKDISPPSGPGGGQPREYAEAVRSIRGREIAMIFQDPMTYLNPVLKIKRQLTESIRLHTPCTRGEARGKAAELLGLVGIDNPLERLEQYPLELSGGMRQRVILAIALSCNPKLLIADEPTTALDVTIQAQILELIRDICGRREMSVVMITHDLGIVASLCTRIIIMYSGRILEEGTTDELFYRTKHPYTRGLLNSVVEMKPIPGAPPNLLSPVEGCVFYPRCPHAMRICKGYPPPETPFSATHRCRCWRYAKEQAEFAVKGRESQ